MQIDKLDCFGAVAYPGKAINKTNYKLYIMFDINGEMGNDKN